MVANITYTKTTRGQRAFIKELPDAVAQVLSVIKNQLTEEMIFAKLQGISKQEFTDAMTWLLEGGFIKLTDAEPIPDIEPNVPTHADIQVSEISLDEFSAASKPAEKEQVSVEKDLSKHNTASPEDKAAPGAAAEKEAAKLKAATVAKKLETRLEAIKKTKRAAAAKAEELAQRQAEIQAKKAVEINNTKKEWSQLKTEAKEKVKEKARVEERIPIRVITKPKQKEKELAQSKKEIESKAKAEEKAKKRAEAAVKKKESAKKWARLKKEAQEKAAQKSIEQAEKQVRNKRLARQSKARNNIKQWFVNRLSDIKTLFVFILIMLGLLALAAYFLNIPALTNKIESFISNEIGTNVDIQSSHIGLLPKPHLLLKGISIENAPELQVQKIHIYPNIVKLKERFVNHLDIPYTIESIQTEGLTVTQKDIAHLTDIGEAATENKQFVIKQLRFKALSLQLGDMALQPLNGDILLEETSGAFKQAVVRSQEKDFSLTIHADNGDYLLDIDANNWRAPIAPFPVFTQLTANGIMQADDLTFKTIAGSLYNGTFTSKLYTNLATPKLDSKGSFQLNNIAIDQLANKLEFDVPVTGTLSTEGRFSFDIDKALSAIDASNLKADFNVDNGVLKKIDIAEAMRTGNIAGSTTFSQLKGNVILHNNHYQFTDLILKNNKLQAVGRVNISDEQRVSAAITSTIDIKDNPITRDLLIQGTANALELQN